MPAKRVNFPFWLIPSLLVLSSFACSEQNPDKPNLPDKVDKKPWVNRTWVATAPNAPPGTLRIFLENGSLLMDSCWETYRLSQWQSAKDSTLSWTEDSATIEADVDMTDSDKMKLTLKLAGETREEHYQEATLPFTCPDMPRQ